MIDSSFNLSGKVSVVTGGCGLLGAQYCNCLSEAGAHVIIADLEQKKCLHLENEIREKGFAATGMAVDLSDETSVKSWAEKIKNDFSGVDIIVNNAAIKTPGFFTPLEEYKLEDWNGVLAVNITAMFLIVRELGPAMLVNGKGSIINISSIYGVVAPDQRLYEGSGFTDTGNPFNTPLVYSVTKGAVIAFTRYLAAYWGPRGIRVNTLTPGGVFSGQNDTFTQKYSSKVPLGRMAEKEELLGALLFLASDASSYVNGQNIIVDGGLTIW